MSDETLQYNPDTKAILEAITALTNSVNDLRGDFNTFKFETDAQLESIRQGIYDNNVRLSKMLSLYHNLGAELAILAEEVRHNRKVLV